MRRVVVTAGAVVALATTMAVPANAKINAHAVNSGGAVVGIKLPRVAGDVVVSAVNTAWRPVQQNYNGLSNRTVESTLCPWLATGGYLAGTGTGIAQFVAASSAGPVLIVNCNGRVFVITT